MCSIVWYLCDTDDTHCLIWSSMCSIVWFLCDTDDTHCLIWSSIWTIVIYHFCVIRMTLTVWYGPACELSYTMIFVWYRWHSLFDMVQYVIYHMIFVWYRWHSLFDMVQYVLYRMIFVWYRWHSLFDMVQHVNYRNLWLWCDTDDTQCLIRFSMWTIVIYHFCVIRMTLTVWYGPACELS